MKLLNAAVPKILLALFGTVALCTLNQAFAQTANPTAGPKTFATPEEAADALIQAAEKYDVDALLEIYGADGKDLVVTGDPVEDKKRATDFAALAHEKKSLEFDSKNPARATVEVGENEWPLPVPIVKRNGRWLFDAKAGRQEILLRRIGANELDAIEICRGYVDAQREYAFQQHDNSGINEYAQKIISTPGKKDGLVWRNEDGSLG